MNEDKWATRKIRKGGRVKIGGYWWVPDARFMKYDGRLDSMVFVFGRYKDYSGYINLLNMWGTKETSDAIKSGNEKEYHRLWKESPAWVVGKDGVSYDPWCFWKHEEEKI
jgi:hypothetical protein